jgi:REP element-mobilizing transposase RayT
MMPSMRQFRRQRIRLSLERYADQGTIWHVTITTVGRRTTLTKPALTAALTGSLRTACSNADASLLLYCLMPEHLHALIEIEEVDLISIIRNYKSFSTRIWWQHGGAGKLWQRSAYDRGIRQPEYMDDLIGYVFQNPADAGEIEDWLERGLLGGSLIDEGT